MAIEYDLIILGGTPEGLEAADRATQMGARVALVLQGLDGQRSPLQLRGLFDSLQTSQVPSLDGASLTPWQWLSQRTTLIADTLTHEALPKLAVQGCDVISEVSTVSRDRPLTVVTPTRQLTTRFLLLATGQVPQLPPIPGLAAATYDTVESLLKRETLPESVVILGGAPIGLALAQLLRRLNVEVTVITAHDVLLPQEDPTVAHWLTAQLRASGVRLKFTADVLEVAADETTATLKLRDTTLVAARLVVSAPNVPNLKGLESADWWELGAPLTINQFLQTQHPRIYACGSVLGGYEAPAIAQQEARIAVHNALFWNRRAIDYGILPYDLPTTPAIARVGLTEPQARQRFDSRDLLIAQQTLYHHPKAQWRASTSGFCKLIAHQDGRILGGHGIGIEAESWIQTLAWLMQRQTPWWHIAQRSGLPHSLTMLLPQTCYQWERQRWQPGQWRRNWTENWCNWRRSR